MNLPFWTEFLEKYSHDKNPVFFSLISQLEGVDLTGDLLILRSSNVGVKSYVENKKGTLEQLIEQYMGRKVQVEVLYEAKAPSKKDLPVLSYEPSKEDVFLRAGLNLKYKFENFAVSSTNQVAFATAQAVAANPGTSYNPLFLYGGVGVGKTHLAQAIARNIMERDNEAKALFAPGDRFINEHIEAIRERTTARFRRKYRYLNIFIVDDVQFISGKNSVQEEFFHTFNSIVSSGGQVVLTSDKPPSEIKDLEDRLRSRFSGGLIVDIQPPDFELRTAILLIKAREKGIELDIEVAKVIAEQVGDTRALEGALISIYAKTLGKKDHIDFEAVDAHFSERQVRTASRVSPSDIIKAVCTFYNVKPSQIKSPVRSEHIAFARQVIMYLIRKELHLNYDEIAVFLNRKDHTTIMHGEKKISSQMMKDPTFKKEVDTIVQSLHAST